MYLYVLVVLVLYFYLLTTIINTTEENFTLDFLGLNNIYYYHVIFKVNSSSR